MSAGDKFVAALDALCNAVNDANDAFRAYAEEYGVEAKGNLFRLVENKEPLKALDDRQAEFVAAVFALLAEKLPGGVN
jgi:hypothetical protein